MVPLLQQILSLLNLILRASNGNNALLVAMSASNIDFCSRFSTYAINAFTAFSNNCSSKLIWDSDLKNSDRINLKNHFRLESK